MFNVVAIGEDNGRGQQIEAFALDALTGTEWKEIAHGTTVGWKKLLRFSTVETTKLRLRILKSRASPLLSLDCYYDPFAAGPATDDHKR
jgi:alpha-L-fucosidase